MIRCNYCACITEMSHGWQYCVECDVYFDISERSKDLHIKWVRKINDAWWALNIFPDRNISCLSGYFPDTANYDEILINNIVTVNKDNVEQKIKTILIFQ